MYRIQFMLILLVSNNLQSIITLPQGAPDSVCHSLLPFHGGGIPRASSRSPFRIVPHNVAVNQGQILRVEIKPQIPELSFGGFMIHARNINPPYQVVGRFAPPPDNQAKFINCGGFENTATHTSPSAKSGISLQWQAPSDFLGEIVFNATVAQEYAKFWVGIESPIVNIVSRNVPIQPSYGITTRRPPFQQAVPNYDRPINDQYERQSDPIYEGCGETKTCFGFPDGCVSTKSCRAVTTAIVRGERYEFELKSSPRDRAAYVAVALSHDSKMGDDSVMECVPVKLAKAELPSWFDWILVAFVAFHVIVHLMLSICGCVSERSAQRVNNFPMADMSPSRTSMKERKLDAPFSGLFSHCDNFCRRSCADCCICTNRRGH